MRGSIDPSARIGRSICAWRSIPSAEGNSRVIPGPGRRGVLREIVTVDSSALGFAARPWLDRTTLAVRATSSSCQCRDEPVRAKRTTLKKGAKTRARRRLERGVLFALALSTWSRRAASQGAAVTLPLTLDWSAPAGCPTREHIIERVAAILGRSTKPPGALAVRAIAAQSPSGQWRVNLARRGSAPVVRGACVAGRRRLDLFAGKRRRRAAARRLTLASALRARGQLPGLVDGDPGGLTLRGGAARACHTRSARQRGKEWFAGIVVAITRAKDRAMSDKAKDKSVDVAVSFVGACARARSAARSPVRWSSWRGRR
jgi:hypothetical protein